MHPSRDAGLSRRAPAASTPLLVQGRRLAGAGPGGGAAAAAGGPAAGRPAARLAMRLAMRLRGLRYAAAVAPLRSGHPARKPHRKAVPSQPCAPCPGPSPPLCLAGPALCSGPHRPSVQAGPHRPSVQAGPHRPSVLPPPNGQPLVSVCAGQTGSDTQRPGP